MSWQLGMIAGLIWGFMLGHWLGARWGIRHAKTSQRFADFWRDEFMVLLNARLGESGKESK